MSPLMEDDIEAGLGMVSGVGSLNGSFVVRFIQETPDEVRPLLHKCTENQEINPGHAFRINFGQKPVKDESKSTRPPKPPRHPKGPTLDAYDLKLIRELSELALERRMRIERIKELKKKRASKAAASSSNSTITSLIFTLLVCIIILYQGVCSGSTGSAIELRTSTAPALSPRGEELIPVQVFRNLSPTDIGNGGSSETLKYFAPILNEGLTRNAG